MTSTFLDKNIIKLFELHYEIDIRYKRKDCNYLPSAKVDKKV